MSVGRFCWHDLMTPDPAAAAGFYAELLPWKARDADTPPGAYTVFSDGQRDAGAFVAMRGDGAPPPHWMPYVAVSDCDAACAQAEKLGGSVCVPPTDIPDVGRFAIIDDTSSAGGARGAALSIITPARTLAGPAAGPPQVGQFCWYTVLTHSADKTKAFYSELFGWQVKPAGEGLQQDVFHAGDQPIAGFVDVGGGGASAALPPMWSCSVVVADLDATAERAGKLGGTLLMPAAPVGEMGRQAVIADPTGAALSYFEPKGAADA